MKEKIHKKPIIGIVLDSAVDSQKYSFAAKPWYALRKCYAEAVSLGGGVPVFLSHDISHIESFLSFIDGLLIPGGDEDINPKFYNQEITSSKVKVNDSRASFELLIAQRALDMNMPIFGICNGLQLLNVALGGTLIQHIPDVIKHSEINHEQPPPKDKPSHAISVMEDTMLFEIAEGKREFDVNSTHHQAIDIPGKGVVVSAISPDGVIEAIEVPNYNFVIGVQWHSEYLNTDLDHKLFSAFVNNCILDYKKKTGN